MSLRVGRLRVCSNPFVLYILNAMHEAYQFSLPAYAKINWFLRILGKRDDGFHELCTSFQTVSLADTLTFAPNERLTMTCSDKTIPVDSGNLVMRAGQLLQKRFEVSTGASIHLEKVIPSPGGLVYPPLCRRNARIGKVMEFENQPQRTVGNRRVARFRCSVLLYRLHDR